MSLHQLIGKAELPERLDLPLGTGPQRRVGAPQDVVGADVAQQGA
jgi:hypothetical protein